MNSNKINNLNLPKCYICKSPLILDSTGKPFSIYCQKCGKKTLYDKVCNYLKSFKLDRRTFLITVSAGAAGSVGAVGTTKVIDGVELIAKFAKKKYIKYIDKRNKIEALRLFNKFIGYERVSNIAMPGWTYYPDKNIPIHDIWAQNACSEAFRLYETGKVEVGVFPFLSGVHSIIVGGASSSQFSKVLMEQSVLNNPKKERPEFRGQLPVLPLKYIPISEPDQLPSDRKELSYVQFGMDYKGSEKAFPSRQWGFVETIDGRINENNYVMSSIDKRKPKVFYNEQKDLTVTGFSLMESPILITRIANYVGPSDQEVTDEKKKLPPKEWSRVKLLDGATGPATGAIELLLGDPGPLQEVEKNIDAERDYQILLMAKGIEINEDGIHEASRVEYVKAVNLDISDKEYINAYKNSGPHYEFWIRNQINVNDFLEGKSIRE